MLDPVRQQQMADWGFNSMRLGSMWSGVEPEEGMVRGRVGVLQIEYKNLNALWFQITRNDMY